MDNKQEIKQIFETMEYKNITEDLSLAQSWFKEHPKIYERFTFPDIDKILDHRDVKSFTGEKLTSSAIYDEAGISEIITTVAAFKEWHLMLSIERAIALNNFAKEISLNTELISEIEVSTRGILRRDTMNKSIPLIVEYLRYYSNLAVGITNDTPRGLVASIIPSDCFLGTFAFILGSVLAAGHNLVVYVAPQLSPCVFLLTELSVKAGIPKGTFRLIPVVNMGTDVALKWDSVNFLAVFDTLNGPVQNEFIWGERILQFSSLKIPSIVFSNADISSACDSLVKSIWEHQGMLPWSVRNIFVQEDILNVFLKAFKKRVEKLKVGQATELLADITYPTTESILLLKQIIQNAKTSGIEIYQPKVADGDYQPTIFVGASPETDAKVPFAVISGFRTLNEAVTLANNNRQGFGVVIWTESISIINEVSRKLKVSNVWVNMEGTLKPDVPFSGLKESGIGHFGGREGLGEYKILKNTRTTDAEPSSIHNKKTSLSLSVVISAQKAQEKWEALGLKKRITVLKKAAEGAPKSWKELIYEAVFKATTPVFSIVDVSCDVNVKQEPLGVIAIIAESDLANKLTIAAILFGNSVILVTNNANQKKQYESIINSISVSGTPKGVLTVLDNDDDVMRALGRHKEIKQLFMEGGYRNFEPINKILQVYPVLSDWDHILCNVVMKKAVWTTVGQSFI